MPEMTDDQLAVQIITEQRNAAFTQIAVLEVIRYKQGQRIVELEGLLAAARTQEKAKK